MSSEALHEDRAVLGKDVLDRHRAIATIMEELEAVDWYDQRIAATDNAELKAILTHNRDEEKEHASMLLEWLRRNDAALARHMGAQLFRDGPVEETAEIETEASGGPTQGDASLGIGSLGIGSLGIGNLGVGSLGIGSLRATGGRR
ncbi:MAG TPA: encapsulin-associated ferritin-like protein [Acetobacteraceae bacterium]